MSDKEITVFLREIARPLGVVYISSYIPRKCGLATFTKDLTNAINLLDPLSLAKIIAMNNGDSARLKYPPEVIGKINQENWKHYEKAAKIINESDDINVVSVQHEFGIYGGEAGKFVVKFLDLLKKPIVTTLHTVVSEPTPEKKEILQEVCKKSKFVVVMIEEAVNILEKEYGVNRDKVVTIHHGVPDFPRLDSCHYKKLLRLKTKTVMVSANLLSEWKGIEYAIAAIPDIVKVIPNFMYLVVGQTHPSYLKSLKQQYGHDTYREKLVNMTKDLKIEKHVRFVNQYVSLTKLKHYIGAADYYITPYSIDSQQSTSGSLAYAIGAGKLCISTPYTYAKEMLKNDRGILVPFKNSREIAKEVVAMHKNSEEKNKIEEKAYDKGRTMTWINIGHLYFHLFKMAIHGYSV